MSEVRKWLEAIDLAQYADAFEANDLDIDLLGQVDDQMLKDIGVSSAGHRLRIRNAIAKLGTQVKNESTHGPLTAAGETSAERRQVTVMFSDFVGSTALSARMDSEDLREFRNNPDDNFMIALFADLWLRQYAAFRHAIDSTQQK